MGPQQHDFQQGTQFGYLNPDRLTVTPINSFADGTTNQDGVPVDTRVNLRGLVNTYSVYATDTINVGKSLAVTLSGRYNRTPIDNIDRLPPPLVAGSRGSLNGQYVFQRFNPAAGLTYSVDQNGAACISATARPAARPRRSNWAAPIRRSRAICRMRW